MEELIQANYELMEQNEKLKRDMVTKEDQYQAETDAGVGKTSEKGSTKGNLNTKKQAESDSLHAEMVIELNEQIDE